VTTNDVSVGDDVKNGRSGKWGKVVRVDTDGVTGDVVGLRVQRHIGGGHYQHEPTWWPAASITMTERKR